MFATSISTAVSYCPDFAREDGDVDEREKMGDGFNNVYVESI
jgi:hypothetical protein